MERDRAEKIYSDQESFGNFHPSLSFWEKLKSLLYIFSFYFIFFLFYFLLGLE